MNKPSLTGLKAGDTVFVVHQSDRHRDCRTEKGVVDRVGTKYAYLKRGEHWSMPFCKNTGISVHDRDSNARSNGYGFDIYRTEDEYLRFTKAQEELARLRVRMIARSGSVARTTLQAKNRCDHTFRKSLRLSTKPGGSSRLS